MSKQAYIQWFGVKKRVAGHVKRKSICICLEVKQTQ